MKKKERATYIYKALRENYKNLHTPLENWDDVDWKFLICVVLSAQTTDIQVNKVTKFLFEKYPGLDDLANAKAEDVEKIIHSLGFYRVKTKHITALAAAILKDYHGSVPLLLNELIKLPGVGRKTANVFLSLFGSPSSDFGVAVDTHVLRLSNRFGLTDSRSPQKVERVLKELFPENAKLDLSLLLITHGRRICTARKPKCEECVLAKYCSYFKNLINE